MVLGLLILSAIPTTIGIAEGISAQKNQKNQKNESDSDKQLRKFTLECWCEEHSRIHGSKVVLSNGKVWVQPNTSIKTPLHPFEGFYVEYPDPNRPRPLPLGLVSTTAADPPMLNWIYIDKSTLELKHGNRTQSIEHRVGSWGWTSEPESHEIEVGGEKEEGEDAGGLTFEEEEKFVVVEPEGRKGAWEVFWDEGDDLLKGKDEIGRRRVVRVSLERTFVEPPKATKGEKS